MKKLLAGIAAFSVGITSPGIAHAQQIQIIVFAAVKLGIAGNQQRYSFI